MDALISLLVFVVIVAVVVWCLLYIIGLLPLPEPFGKVATVLIMLIAVLLVLQRALPMLGV